jgi:alpha-D-ribose 1-methylphosphonate 5-triphosphate diphosphatase PhnM
MHFDQRTQRALRDAGLDTEAVEAISTSVVEATQAAADRIESFFDGRDTVYSDMDLAHSTGDVTEHVVEYVDIYTHAADLRGYLRFDSWGVYVEGGRVLTDETVELTLGPTVHDRVRFTTDPDAL